MSRPQARFARLALAACGVWMLAAGWNAAQSEEPAGLRVFYTGHSFHMFVPRHIDALVKAAGIPQHQQVGAQGIGGSRVIQHWDLADDKNMAKKALASGNVDVFTMAAHLMIPDDGITRFTELGLMHNPRLRLLVQASWYPFDIPGERRIRDNKQRDGMEVAELQAPMDEWRARLEAQVDRLNEQHDRRAVGIVPVGDSVVKLRGLVIDEKFPGIKTQSELFTDPIGHAGPHVQALAAYCNFAAIYCMNPQGLKVATPNITAEQHEILQQIAWETVSQYPYAGIAKAAKPESIVK